MIKPLDLARTEELQGLVKSCHLTRTPRSNLWYFANPTIVIDSDTGYVGYANFCIGFSGISTLYALDMGVREDYRGKGLATQLLHERARIARALGLKMLLGAARPDNFPVIRILEGMGMHACQEISGYYQDEDPPRDGIIYSGSVEKLKIREV